MTTCGMTQFSLRNLYDCICAINPFSFGAAIALIYLFYLDKEIKKYYTWCSKTNSSLNSNLEFVFFSENIKVLTMSLL